MSRIKNTKCKLRVFMRLMFFQRYILRSPIQQSPLILGIFNRFRLEWPFSAQSPPSSTPTKPDTPPAPQHPQHKFQPTIKARSRPRQGLNRVARRGAEPGPRGAEATLGAPASPLGQPPAPRGLPVKARQPPKSPHSHTG